MPRRRYKSPRNEIFTISGEGWLALTKTGSIAGRGLTAAEARAQAQLSRSKESFQVVYLPPDSTPPLDLPPIFEQVKNALTDSAYVWLVGGAVRDLLLRQPIHDLDFVVDGDALALAQQVAHKLGGAYFPLDEERGTGRVIVTTEAQRTILDFAELRGEVLNDDLAARDFTINALALSLTAQPRLYDPLNGQADLKTKTLRACTPQSFTADPARVLRVVRLAAQLEFHIERETREAARAASPLLANVSAERVRDEFLRILAGRKPAVALKALDMLGALQHIVPEVIALKGVTQSAPHEFDVWQHTLTVIERLEMLLHLLQRTHDMDAASKLVAGLATLRLSRYRAHVADHLDLELSVGRGTRGLLFLAALLHDIAKPQTRTVEASGRIRFLNHDDLGAKVAHARATALRLANEEVERITLIVQHHMRPNLLAQQGDVSPRAAYRFFKATHEAGIGVCLLSLADYWGKGSLEVDPEEWVGRLNIVATLLDAIFMRREEIVAPPALITGDDVMRELNLPPSKKIGEVLEAVREAQVAGEVLDRATALQFILTLKT